MPGVERGEGALAADAIAVLRKQRVIALDANGTGVVDRSGISIGGGHAEATAEALGGLKGEGVVHGVTNIFAQLNVTEVLEGKTRGCSSYPASGNSFVM